MNAGTNFSAVSSASLTGIHRAHFVKGSMIGVTASYPASDVGSLVTKSIFTCSARSSGIGSACRSPYGLAFLCLMRWQKSHPVIHSAIESVIFGQWYHDPTAAAVFAVPMCPASRIVSCASRITSDLKDLGMHNFPPEGVWNKRPSSSV